MNAEYTSRLPVLLASVLTAAGLFVGGPAWAGATIKIDDTKWISVGAGLRSSFSAVEDGAGRPGDDKFSTDFALNNVRLYINGQIHKYIKFTFNTECENCSDDGDIRVLDAIAKFEIDPIFNIWGGRTLVPAERQELNGPFYSNTFDAFKTPFEPADFGIQGQTGFSAGTFGRDDGVVFWGALTPDKRLNYAVGVFDGLDGGANQDDNLLYAGRLSYNFLSVEDNPGYYTSSTYYGKGGDIFTIAGAAQYQEDGAGSEADPGNFLGFSGDLLFEKVFANEGVLTLDAEYKNYNITDVSNAELRGPDSFALFEGNSVSGTLLYLIPARIGIGQFQPYVRYTQILPDASSDRYEAEGGVNYVIDGHNARVSLFYQHGDLATKGLDYSPTADGDEVSAIRLGVQLQI